MRVCIASSFPEQHNRNISIVGDLAEGFLSHVDEEELCVARFLGFERHVEATRPSLVVLIGSPLPARADYLGVARACRKVGATFAFWTVEDPYEFDANYKFTEYADIVFTNDAWAREFYDHPHVHHLPTAASPRRWRSLDGYADRSLDLFFCGVGFANRQTFVTDAMPILERRRTVILGDGWKPHPGGVVRNRRINDETLTEYYAATRCVLNMGRNHSYANERRALQAVTPGPRTFDAAMVGCVQLYHKPSRYLADYFKLGEEMETFETVEEFRVKLDRLLGDPVEAVRLARAAQLRVMKDHTYAARARKILDLVGQSASKPGQAAVP